MCKLRTWKDWDRISGPFLATSKHTTYYFVLDAIHIYREKYINLTTMLLPWNNKLTWKWIDFSVPWTSVNDFWDQIITVRYFLVILNWRIKRSWRTQFKNWFRGKYFFFQIIGADCSWPLGDQNYLYDLGSGVLPLPRRKEKGKITPKLAWFSYLRYRFYCHKKIAPFA